MLLHIRTVLVFIHIDIAVSFTVRLTNRCHFLLHRIVEDMIGGMGYVTEVIFLQSFFLDCHFLSEQKHSPYQLRDHCICVLQFGLQAFPVDGDGQGIRFLVQSSSEFTNLFDQFLRIMLYISTL